MFNAAKKIELTNFNELRRVAWAESIKHWDLEKWKMALFVDESLMNTSGNDGHGRRVRRRKGQ